MGRRLRLLALAAAIAVLVSPGAQAATPIPGTPLNVVDLTPSSQIISFGASTNFSWGIYNGGMGNYDVNVSATPEDPSFVLALSATSLLLRRDDFIEVHLNATAPTDGEARTTVIHVWFNVTSPTTANLERNVTLTARAEPASVDVLTAFLAVGGIIAIGFTAMLIFERTRVPDLLILIFLGVLLGPVALIYFGVSFVPPGVLQLATPYFTALALMMILFDGGLNLRLKQVIKHLGLVGLHTGVAFILTIFAVAFVTATLLGYPWLVGLLLGAILGGTSGAVIIGIVRSLRVTEETKIILTMESVLTDVLCVVTALALIELLRGGPDAPPLIVFFDLAQAFAVSLVFGVAFGVGWLLLLNRLERKPFSYMLTIAVLFVLYSLAQGSGGNGAMASFVFGLVLGNHQDFAKWLKIRGAFLVDDRIRQFHGELSFVIRTFFFVFLGVVFTFDLSGAWSVSTGVPVFRSLNGTFLLFLIGVMFIFVAIVAVRLVTARLVTWIHPKPPAERRVLWTLMGRGLAAAVLASLPFTISAFTAPSNAGDVYYATVLAPYARQFLNIAFYVILLTVAATTIGVAASERALGKLPAKIQMVGVDGPGIQMLRGLDLEDIEIVDRPSEPP